MVQWQGLVPAWPAAHPLLKYVPVFKSLSGILCRRRRSVGVQRRRTRTSIRFHTLYCETIFQIGSKSVSEILSGRGF